MRECNCTLLSSQRPWDGVSCWTGLQRPHLIARSMAETKDESKQISSSFFSPSLIACLFHLEIISLCVSTVHWGLILSTSKHCLNTKEIRGTITRCLGLSLRSSSPSKVWSTTCIGVKSLFLILCSASLYGIILYCFLSKCFITNSINEPLGVAKCVWLHAGPRERIMEHIRHKEPQLACKQGSLINPASCPNRWALKTETSLNSGLWGVLEGHQMLQSWELGAGTWPPPDPT